VRLQVSDVCVGGRVRDRATVIQRKTGRPKSPDKPTLTEFAPKVRFASDSPLEGSGFELSVPRETTKVLTPRS
jgi:hypothetical protein